MNITLTISNLVLNIQFSKQEETKEKTKKESEIKPNLRTYQHKEDCKYRYFCRSCDDITHIPEDSESSSNSDHDAVSASESEEEDDVDNDAYDEP